MLEREETIDGIIHPEFIGGRVVWSQGGTSPDALADKLRFGDPTKGWEGDERLALCFNPEGNLWEVWRLDQNQYHIVCRRSADLPLDERVIDLIMARDMRRNPHALQEMYAHNDRIDAEKEKKSVETLLEAHDRLRYEVRKAGVV